MSHGNAAGYTAVPLTPFHKVLGVALLLGLVPPLYWEAVSRLRGWDMAFLGELMNVELYWIGWACGYRALELLLPRLEAASTGRVGRVVLHALAALLLPLAVYALTLLLLTFVIQLKRWWIVEDPRAFWQPARESLELFYLQGVGLFRGLLVYLLVLGAITSRRMFHRVLAQQQREAELQHRLDEARLQGLRMQLQPHFLFNTLNSISALLQEDPVAADEMLERLAGFLRLALEDAERPRVPLRRELEYTRAYLEIEEVRFADRLRVDWAVDPEGLDEEVPWLILQPLVENAFVHGISERSGAGRIALCVTADSAGLRIGIRNSLPEEGRATPAGRGTGLANVRQRLELEYGPRASLRSEKEGEEWLAEMVLGTAAKEA